MRGLLQDERGALFVLRAVTAVALGFLWLYNPEAETPGLAPALWIGLYAATDLLLLRLSRRLFDHPSFRPALFLGDVLVVSAAIYSSEGWNGDFFLIYFLVILMSGIQMEVWQSFLVGAAACVLYPSLWRHAHPGADWLDPSLLLRLPFLFVVSVFSAVLAQSAKTRLKAQEERHGEELREVMALLAVYRASRALFSAMSLENLLPRLAKLSAEVLKADDAVLLLRTQDGGLETAAAIGLARGDEEARRSRLELARRVMGRRAPDSPPSILGPPAGDPDLKDLPLKGVAACLVCPLTAQGEAEGAWVACRRVSGGPFSGSDAREAVIFSSLMAQAIRNARIHRALEEKVRDLEEANRRLKEANFLLIRTEKLATVGQLAAGIAHELNNPLAGSLGLCRVLAEDGSIPESARRDFEAMRGRLVSCASIVKDLLTFARQETPRREPVGVGPLLEAVVNLCRHDFEKAGLGLEQDAQASLPPVLGDPSLLQQVFMNLATNARHAMEGRQGAKLKITASREGDALSVRFQDEGCGIPRENLGRIFDPFFTTKPPGRGTGLGLSISHGIIQQHGGRIEIESVVGKGSAFTVQLPL